MARKTWESVGGVAYEIIQGLHDEQLDYIAQACKARLKNRFRPGQKVKLTGTRNVELDGQVAVIVKVNTKSISVQVGEVTDPRWAGRRPTNAEFDRMSMEDLDAYFKATEHVKEYNVPPQMLEALAA